MHSGGIYSNVRIDLDDQTYEGCAFDGCTIVYSGRGPYRLNNCTFSNCQFSFEGCAAMTLKYLSDMYRVNAPWVDDVISRIRSGSIP